MAGITESGLVIKRMPEIIESLHLKAKAEFGETINLEQDSVLGHLIAIFSAEIADAWEGVQGVYDASYPNSADGINLDNVSSLLGITRLDAQSSQAEMRITGNVSTVVPIGATFEQVGTGKKFETRTTLTLASSSFNVAVINVSTVATSTLYSVTIGGTTRSYTSGVSTDANTIASGLVAQINSPAFGVTAVNNLDGTFSISLAGVEERTLTFTANLTPTKVARIVTAYAQETGPIPADANTIAIIKTPVFGMDFVTNPLPAVEGRNEETDAELRTRRLESVQLAGAGTVDAIRAQIAQVDGVTNSIVIENDTNATDVDGRPAKSFEVVVEGGDDQDIGDTIWLTKPAGIQSFGDIPVVVTDAVGKPHTVYFSRPEIVYIHFNVVYTLYSEEMFPGNGVQAIKDAMVEYGNTLAVGEDVILQRFLGPIYSKVPGIASLTITAATSVDGLTPGSYTSANRTISGTQVAAFAVSRINVTL